MLRVCLPARASKLFAGNGLMSIRDLAGRMLRRLSVVSIEDRLRQLETVWSRAASESRLVARAQRGEEEAFAALFDAHKRPVYSLSLRMTGDPAEAEKILQEAFIQLFRRMSAFRGESDFSTELYRLVLKAVLMRLREKRTPIGVGGVFE
jgi:hypothetical protein